MFHAANINNGVTSGKILLLEDNPGDVRLIKEAIKEINESIELTVVSDGVEAIDYLFNKENVMPDLILMDLNVPKKNGISVLKEVKKNPAIKQIPVVILTISKAPKDILECYNLNVSCYINKPFEIEKYLYVIKEIINFWFNVATLPKKEME